MAGLKQSKRVSWSEALYQVRLFLAEDAPALSGVGTQDNLQAKGSWLLHATGIGNDDSLPPGFEAPHPAYHFKSEISQISIVKWKRPLKILLNPEWLVVCGQESVEVPVQNHRQMRVLEAIYPRLSSIPPNSSVSSEVQDSIYDDAQTPLIPVTAIEDEDSLEQLERASPTVASTQMQHTNVQNLQGMNGKHDIRNLKLATEQSSQGHVAQPASGAPRGEMATNMISPIAEPDVTAAAFTAIMKSSKEGSMIDHDLLISILSNPSLVEKLVSEHGAPKQAQATPISVTPCCPPVPVQSPAPPLSVPPLLPQINTSAPSPLPVRTTQMYPVPSLESSQAANRHVLQATQIPIQPPASGHSTLKDPSYYKSLVQQHGGERQEAPDLIPVHAASYQNNVVVANAGDLVSYGPMQQRGVRPKFPKLCVYFNTPKGCRHGASCSYQHDTSLPLRNEQPKGSKRIKLDR